MVGSAVVIMVVSRAARKTEKQRESMMIVVWSFVREASGLGLGAPLLVPAGASESGGFSAVTGSSSSMLAEEEELWMVLSLEVSMSMSSRCCCFSSVCPSNVMPRSAPTPASACAVASFRTFSSIVVPIFSFRLVSSRLYSCCVYLTQVILCQSSREHERKLELPLALSALTLAPSPPHRKVMTPLDQSVLVTVISSGPASEVGIILLSQPIIEQISQI